MGEEFRHYLPTIIPSIFDLLKKVFVPNGSTDKSLNFQTYDTDEATIAINMLSVIIDEMSVHFIEYVQPALDIIIPLCNYATNQEIRKASVTCLSGLVKAANTKDPVKA
jgi:hypothetical protein